MGQLVKLLQVNFGARCDAYAAGGQLYLKFELYGTLKGQSEAQTIDQFNDPVKNFAEMQALIKKKVPAIFDKITKSPQEVCEAGRNIWENGVCKTAVQIAKEVCQSEGKNWIDGACKPRAQIACEVTTGRKWVDGECKTVEQIACESKGNVWVNGVCRSQVAVPPPIASETSGVQSGAKNDAEAYYKSGNENYKKGDYDKAISDFTEAIRLKPKFAEAYNDRGAAYPRKSADKAISDFTEALRLNPNYALAYYNRCVAYDEKGDYDKAISDCTEAIRLNPKFAKAYYNRGIVYYNKGDYDRAVADFKSALQIDPNNTNARNALEKIRGKGVFTDSRDGKKYKIVKIGNQTWMAENLNYNASGSKCYENNSANCAKYGRLYNWETAKKACPSGWHLPSKIEYEVLDKAVGGEKVAGKKLKAKSGWNKNGNGTDEFGFSTLPGGIGGSDGSFGGVGDFGYWWSSSEFNSGYAYRWVMYDDDEYALWYYDGKGSLFSVRCLQDYGEARR